jgi:hypothetical protein
LAGLFFEEGETVEFCLGGGAIGVREGVEEFGYGFCRLRTDVKLGFQYRAR